MKKLLPLLLLLSSLAVAEDIVGDWHGQLDVQGSKLRLSFYVSQEGKQYTSTMDSLDQNATGIATSSTSFSDNTLSIAIKDIGVEYSGKLEGNKITGTFKQGGMQFPLELKREQMVVEKKKLRAQEPIKPYPYISEDIYFINEKANGIKLAGTLTLPKDIKNPTVAILISGSGPQNRDEELLPFNHRPFLVLSDYLTRNGIAVLRFDDRGVAESEGSRETATSADYSTDVEAAVNYLKTRTDVIDPNKIGLIGHSEGGLIAPMVAARNKDVAYIILLAGPGVDGKKILISQTRRAAELANEDPEEMEFDTKISKVVFDMIKNEDDLDKLAMKITAYLKKIRKENPEKTQENLTDENIALQVRKLASDWMVYFIRTDPADFIKQVKCPILAINGSLDFQVMPELNLSAIEDTLIQSQHSDFTIKELLGLNHMFQTATTGAITEYATIEETFAPLALTTVSDWIKQRFE